MGSLFIHGQLYSFPVDLSFLTLSLTTFYYLFAGFFLHFPRCAMTLIQAHVASVKSLSTGSSHGVIPVDLHRAAICVHTHRIFRKNRTIESRSTRFRALLHPSNLEIFSD